MRFHIGPIPETPEFDPSAPWRPLREPSPIALQVIALPVGILVTLLVAHFWMNATPLQGMKWSVDPVEIILLLIPLIIVHELIHALVHPLQGRTSDSIVGLWPSRMVFYAAYAGELSKERFLMILLAPLAALTFAPLAIAWLTQSANTSMAFISCANAFAACGDIVGASMVAWQVPARATVRNQGWRTFWKSGISRPEQS